MSPNLSTIKELSPFLDTYLKYVEETESPRIFHIWCALTGISACTRRRVYFPDGPDELQSNLYTVLIGPPGSRKSSALLTTMKLIETHTNVRFAADDTGGQRQGLIKTLLGEEESEVDEMLRGLDLADPASLEVLNGTKVNISGDLRDKHCLFACAEELESFTGINNQQLITFLGRMYDGRRYTYKLTKTEETISDGLISMLAATTPASLVKSMPEVGFGQGFMSRIIFVFGTGKYKDISRRVALPKTLGDVLGNIFSYAAYKANGPMKETSEAAALLDKLYTVPIEIKDTRFVHYMDRRHTHLKKTVVNLAIGRQSDTITIEDVKCADSILRMTEKNMPDALGEFGLTPLAVARQKLLEYMQSIREPVKANILYEIMRRDMKVVDFQTTMEELQQAKQIKSVDTKDGIMFMYVDKLDSAIDEVAHILSNGELKS